MTGTTALDGGSMTFGWQSDLPIFATWSGTHTVVRDSSTVWSGTLSGRVDAHYNNDLRVRRIAVQNGRSLDFTYSADGLLEYVAPTTGTPFPPLTIARSILDGHIESTTLGVVTTTESVDVDPTTPGFGDYLGHTVAVGGTTFYQSSYTYDRLGRIVGWNETIDGTTKTAPFEFDDAGRLTNVRDGVGTLLSEYAYDGNGNRTLADVGGVRRELGVDIGCGAGLTDPANDQDQLCRYGNYFYTYDANGRLAQKAHVTDGSDVTAYTYAGDGRLLRVELPFGGSVIDYVHDATGRRIGRIVDGVFDRGWLYKDGINPVAQLDATGAVEATFVYATRPHVPDFMVMTDGTTYRFVTDHLGSVRALIDATSATVAERIDYDEWGNVTFSTGAWSVQPFGFAGGLHDAATGLVRFGVRDYDPVTGRWTAKEPLGFAADTNFYAYVLGDPIDFLDSTGRNPVAAAVVVILIWGVFNAGSDSADDPNTPSPIPAPGSGETIRICEGLEGPLPMFAGVRPPRVRGAGVDLVRRVRGLPRNARLLTDVDEVFDHLERNNGISRELASSRLHDIKRAAGRGPADDVALDLTGNVYSPETGELLGSLTAGGARGR